jgi:phosphopantothenoylcysteine decarboxylase/phosphopantothenate--cysteine ligase
LVTNLRNKKVIITAGPTWVKIDSVRIISNTASGETGILLARRFNRFKAKVTLLLGPGSIPVLNKGIIVKRFKFFDELKYLIERELRLNKYDLAVHSAAVSDYKPAVSYKKKIASGLNNLKISFKATPKIINIFKRIRPGISLVAFKFEQDASRKKLVCEAKRLIKLTGAGIVVANTLRAGKYAAYLVSVNKTRGPIFSKRHIVNTLIKTVKVGER